MTMVLDRHHDNVPALLSQMFLPFENCDIELNLSHLAESQSDTTDTTFTLSGVNGATVLFLALFDWTEDTDSRFDRQTFANLLASWECGEVILKDIVRHELIDLFMEPRSEIKIAMVLLLRSAYQPYVPFSLETLCGRISLYIRAVVSRYDPQQMIIGKHMRLLDLLKDILQACEPTTQTTPTPSKTMRSFDFFDMQRASLHYSVTAFLYGCIVGTVTIIAMERIQKREHRTAVAVDTASVAAEWAGNLTNALTTVLLAGGISVATDQTREVFCRFFKRRLLKANAEDVKSLRQMLGHVKGCLTTLLGSYDSVIDRNHFYRRFSQAFILTRTHDATDALTHGELLTWFEKTESTDDMHCLLPQEGVWFDGAYGDMFFYDLSLIEFINYPSRHLQILLTKAERDWNERRRVAEWVTGYATPPSWALALRRTLQRNSSQTEQPPKVGIYHELLICPAPPSQPLPVLQRFKYFTAVQVFMFVFATLILLPVLWVTTPPPAANAPRADSVEASSLSATQVLTARVLHDFQASSAIFLFQGDIVFVTESPYKGWYRFEDPTGRRGVGSMT